MSTPVSRRSFIGAMLAIGASRALPQPPPVMADQAIEPEVIDVYELASTNATEFLRSTIERVSGRYTVADCQRFLGGPGDVMDAAFLTLCQYKRVDEAAVLSQLVLWAFQSHAGGYSPEQCSVAWMWGVQEQRRVMSLVVVL